MGIDPVAEIERLRFLVLANLVAKGVVTAAFFGTLIYLAVKLRKDREVVRRYPRSTLWKIFTSRGTDWESLVEPTHRDDLRRRRRALRYILVAYLAFVALTGGLKLLRTHWLSQAQDIVKNLESPPR